MSDPSRPVRYAVTAAGTIYAVALYASGFRFDTSIRQVLAYLPAAAALAIVAFDLWDWKWPGVHRLVQRPRIDGTWLTTLTPHPDSHIPEGGNRGPIDAAVLMSRPTGPSTSPCSPERAARGASPTPEPASSTSRAGLPER